MNDNHTTTTIDVSTQPQQQTQVIEPPQSVMCPICQRHFANDASLRQHYVKTHASASRRRGWINNRQQQPHAVTSAVVLNSLKIESIDNSERKNDVDDENGGARVINTTLKKRRTKSKLRNQPTATTTPPPFSSSSIQLSKLQQTSHDSNSNMFVQPTFDEQAARREWTAKYASVYDGLADAHLEHYLTFHSISTSVRRFDNASTTIAGSENTLSSLKRPIALLHETRNEMFHRLNSLYDDLLKLAGETNELTLKCYTSTAASNVTGLHTSKIITQSKK